MLPNVEFEGIWDSLILEPGVQDSLLDYAQTALRFSDAGVDENIVSWNRLVLLHGPPGTVSASTFFYPCHISKKDSLVSCV
jgi:hypothetical protein